MTKIAIFTSARSDFGLLLPVLRKLEGRAEVHLLVGGSHFSPSRGFTFDEVERETRSMAIRIISVEFLLDGETPAAQAKSIAQGQSSISQLFSMEQYDAVVVLGDRWELFALSIPSLVFGIPLVHISGGEVTEGVIDDSVRHAHSKLAHLHFVAAEAYAENLSRMGEEDWRIVISGECGLDNIHTNDIATREQVLERFGIDLHQKGLLVTFHPTTLDRDIPPRDQVAGLLLALEHFSNIPVIFTAPGVEQGSDVILKQLAQFVAHHPNSKLIPHFGRCNYLAVMKSSLAVVGNSSSGIVEAPSFGVPTVDIGPRQKNRLAATSVVHADYSKESIQATLNAALEGDFLLASQNCKNPYDPYRDGRNSERIATGILAALSTIPKKQFLLKKLSLDIVREQWNRFLVL